MTDKEFDIDFDEEEIAKITNGKEVTDLSDDVPEYELEADDSNEKDVEEEDDEREEDEEQDSSPKTKKRKKGVQERINKAVRAQREAERERDAFRQRLELLETRIKSNEDAYRATEVSNVQSEHDTLRAQHKAALEAEDYEEAEKLSDRLLDLKLKKRELESTRTRTQREDPPHQPQGPDPMTARWVRANSDWWEVDEEKTRRALVIDYELKLDGYNPQDQDFWDELDERLGEQPKTSPKKNRPTQSVASADRGGKPTNKGKLIITKQQQHIARELGIMPNTPEWERFVKNLKAQGGVNA